jgi:hypothetical protein
MIALAPMLTVAIASAGVSAGAPALSATVTPGELSDGARLSISGRLSTAAQGPVTSPSAGS